MSIVRWSPFREFEDLFDRYNRLLGNSPAATGEGSARIQWRPVANVSETDSEYLIKAELPEVDKKDVEVSVEEGVITIKGERRLQKAHESEKQHRVESFYGSFSRSFSLPADVNEAAITAESKAGVLTVRLPKSKTKAAKAVEIKVA